jgi:hypothetical protein
MILQTDIDINRAWEISPYNGLAYGAIVVVLIVIAWYFKNLAENKEIYIRELVNKTHELADNVGDKLSDLKQSKEINHTKIVDMLGEIRNLLNNIK